jgi:hypothetical protein
MMSELYFAKRDEQGKLLGIECEAFIVPNVLIPYEDGKHYRWCESPVRDADFWKLFSDVTPAFEDIVHVSWEGHDYGIFNGKPVIQLAGEADIPAKWIQLWFVDPEEAKITGDSNLKDHGSFSMVPEISNGEYTLLQENFPAFLFKDKCEGDVVEFTLCGVSFKVTLKQCEYRYARFGKFEDAFRHVTR